jgi:DNA topoisomerase-1
MKNRIEKKGLSHQQFLQTDKDHKKAASAAHLIYVNDNMPGINRSKKGKGFIYSFKNKQLKNKARLEQIKKLAIPPSWTNVWICPVANGHIQATGFDLNHRKQYRYHSGWSALRNETKFHHLYEFGKLLPRLRKQIQKDISKKELTEEKVLATAISLMERTYIRVGNSSYEKLYGSYGLTTLKDKHVKIKKGEINFSFQGKKGIEHSITLKNKKLARIVKQCRDIPGKQLFQYYDEEKNKKHIDSGMLNNYIKNATGVDFSAKDLRTWAGSLQAIQSLRLIGDAANAAETKKNILSMLDQVSSKLGNSRNICRKYYVHPGLIKLYEENKLLAELSSPAVKKESSVHGLSREEQILMTVLKNASKESTFFNTGMIFTFLTHKRK